jgi:hypothetical protein
MRTTLSAAILLLAVTGCGEEKPIASCMPALPGWATPETGKPVYSVANFVSVHGREIRWNGVTIDDDRLGIYLRETAAMNPQPFLFFDPQSADCERARQVRDLIDENYPCRAGACGQGARPAFENAAYKQTPAHQD